MKTLGKLRKAVTDFELERDRIEMSGINKLLSIVTGRKRPAPARRRATRVPKAGRRR